MEKNIYIRKTYILPLWFSLFLFSTTRLVPSPTASAATEAVTDGLAPLTSTTTEAAEAAGGGDTGGTIFVVTIVPIFTGELFKITFGYTFFMLYFTVMAPDRDYYTGDLSRVLTTQRREPLRAGNRTQFYSPSEGRHANQLAIHYVHAQPS